MKKLLIIIASVLVLAAIAAIFYAVLRPKPAPPSSGMVQNPFGSTTVSPGAGGASASLVTIPAQGGSSMSVKDFMHNGETVADPVNTGSYVLAGDVGYCLQDGTCPHGAESQDFSIGYDASGTFTVALLREPLGAARLAAEQFLEARLGLTAAQLCSLQYQVLVSQDVNPVYDSGNLGFSACPGAVKLP